MPNSYVENAEKGFDGESMSDWFTGSGCVLLKMIIWYVFGLRADMRGVTIAPAAYIPFNAMQSTFKVKDTDITILYENGQKKARTFYVNGAPREGFFDEKTKAWGVRFENADLCGKPWEVRIVE